MLVLVHVTRTEEGGVGVDEGRGGARMIGISSAQLKPPYSLEFYKFTHFIDYEMPLVEKLVATK